MTKIKTLPAVLVILIIFGSVLGYYYVHKPFDAESGFGLFKAVWQILIALFILTLSGGLGRKILGSQNEIATPIDLVTNAAIGMGLIGILMLALGMTVGIEIIPVLILLGVILVVTAGECLTWMRSWRHFHFPRLSLIQRTWFSLTIIILIPSLFFASAPPIHYDALAYHLSLPQLYAEAGRIIYTPDIMYVGMPQSTEMLFLLAIRLGGLEAATILGWFISMLTLVCLFEHVKIRFSAGAGWASVIALLSGFTFAKSPAWGYNDWTAMLYGLTCLIALDNWASSKTRRDLALAATFAGMALATKYTGGIILVCGIGVIAFNMRREALSKLGSTIFLFASLASLMLLPWIFKNWLQTGNPFYPLLYPAGAMDSIRVAFYQSGTIFGDWLDMILLPVQATVFGVEGREGYSASIGPLLLGFSLVTLIQHRTFADDQKQSLQRIYIFLLTAWMVWAFGSRISALLIQSRLFFPVFPAWAILAGAGYHAIEKERLSTIRLGMIAGILATMVFIFTTVEVVRDFSRQDPAGVVLGATSRDEYLERNLGSFAPAMQAVQDLPSSARVLLLWEPRSLYCLPKCEPDEIIDRWYHDRKAYGMAESILNSWQNEGYTHMLYFKLGADNRRAESKRFISEDWEEMDLLLSKLSILENYNNAYILYSLGGN